MSSYRIFTDTRLSPEVTSLLESGASPHEIIRPAKAPASVLAAAEPDPAFGTAEIAFGQPDVASILGSGKLRWIQLTTAGFTRYDTPEFREQAAAKGVIVTNSSAVYADACAEHVLSFMMARARSLPKALATRVPNGAPEWLALRRECGVLRHRSVLILGYGGIATRLVELLAPFEMDIVAMRRRPLGDEPVPVITPEELPAALAKADHVINILPENADSLNFFNAERFAAMKPGAVFHNIGRGTTVDQPALYAALKSGHLDSAWLDVTEPEPLPPEHRLWTLENCFITPHIAGGDRHESETLVRHFLANLKRFERGEPLKDRVM